MIVPDSEEKSSGPFKSPQHPPSHLGQPNVEGPPSDQPAQTQNPPPYTPYPQGSSVILEPAKPLNVPVGLPPGNYIHIKNKNSSVKEKILLDLSFPPPPASALPPGTQGGDIPHLTLESHNGSVSGEVWVLRAKEDGTAAPRVPKPTRERVRLHFRSHNGSVKAEVHVHPATVEPRPFLSMEARSLNGMIMITIPRSFRGQLTLHTDNGRAHLSSALALHAATLSAVNGTHKYFVGERPRGTWDDGTNGDGEQVDAVMGSTKNGGVKVSYDDEPEPVSGMKGPGVLSSLFKAIGF